MLYGMYLRISELVATKQWQPKMSDFFRDPNGGRNKLHIN